MSEKKSTELVFPDLHEKMLNHRGSQRRTAELYGCSANWVWMVLHGRVELSVDHLQRMHDCALQAIEEIQLQKKKAEDKKEAMKKAMSAKLAAMA